MYPNHDARLTPQEQMLDDCLRLDNHFLARALSLTHHDSPRGLPAAQPAPAGLNAGNYTNTAATAAKGIAE